MSAEWMNLMIELPVEDGQRLLEHLKTMGFADVDWCEMQRPDFAWLSWGPCQPRIPSELTTPPYPQPPDTEGLFSPPDAPAPPEAEPPAPA